MKQQGIAVLLLLLLSSACSIITKYQLQSIQLDKLEKLVELSKGPCYGKCPVYALTVYTNGIVAYEGKQFTNREGVFVTKLSDAELRTLKSDLQAAKLNTFLDGYRSKVPDLQTVTITYYSTDYTKTIVGKDSRPEPVMKIQSSLEALEQLPNWQPLESSTAVNPSDNIGAINQIRVQLKPDTDANAWIRKYGQQQMKLVKGLDIPNNLWLVEFNVDRNDAREMLALVQSDNQVVNAELSR